MQNLTELQVHQIAGGLGSEFSPSNALATGFLIGLATVGAQKIAIDALKPYSKSIVNVDSFSIFLGDKFGTKEHFTHILTSVLALTAVSSLVETAIS